MIARKDNFIFQDVAIIALSVAVAIILVKTETLARILDSVKGLESFGSFFAGIFFTSVFTTAPAIVALGEIARTGPIFSTAIFGAAGAVVGDLIIFRFVRDRLSDHMMQLLVHKGAGKRFKELLKLKYFRWFTFLAGGLIIASPFPDELGISLLGFSKMKTSRFIPISFIFNFIGIVIIGLIARAL